MPDARTAPRVYSIPVHRNFADALANGLIAQTGGDRMVLARAMILLPSNRAVRAVTDAFVRRAEPGLLLPRLVAIGDAGDALGPALDPAGGAPVPPAVDPMVRRFVLARLVREARAEAGSVVDAAEALRLADDLARVLDEVLGEGLAPAQFHALNLASELSIHWQTSLDMLSVILDRWPGELARLGRIDLAERRNLLLGRLAQQWRDMPPQGLVVAAGVTISARAVADLLRIVSRLPQGMVVLPGVDLASPDNEWDAIAGNDERPGIESHPQFHLRLLLDRMGVARSDLARWRWGDGRARQAVRARAVSNAFAPARFTAKWQTLPAPQRRLPGVRLATFATPADEAQGIAIALREALETPGRTAALVTPDRALAGRVVAHLRRWGIDADDSGGQPLSATPPGTLILGLASLVVERFAPVALLGVLKHPLVMAGAERLAWLDGVRALDRDLRGPRPAPGIAGVAARLTDAEAIAWWAGVAPTFAPFEAAFARDTMPLSDAIEAVRLMLETLAGDEVWRGAAGRAAGELFASLTAATRDASPDIGIDAIVPVLRHIMDGVAVRPPQGGHPRLFIWGLIEARLQSADLMILAGLNEGSWPANPAPDAWLAPKVRQVLGLGATERRIGIAAHDLATHLGGREVLLTRARRDARSPVTPSRFLLRLQAMLGGIEAEARLPALAAAIDASDAPPQLAAQPAPSPPVHERPRRISVTEVDRLKADPFAFYARRMLGLRVLDPVDADAAAAWRGSAVHDIFDRWFREDKLAPEALFHRMDALFADAALHPVLRALWAPRLREALGWIADEVAADRAAGRIVIATEEKGAITIAGITLEGRADRIDRQDNVLAIVDYKSGKPPTAKAVKAGFSMQLGLLGLIAERGGFSGIAGTPLIFEYWSLAKDKDRFGKRVSPAKGGTELTPDNFVATAATVFTDAAAQWLTGDAPFTAKLNPEYAPYGDYDQLMRLAEWYGRER